MPSNPRPSFWPWRKPQANVPIRIVEVPAGEPISLRKVLAGCTDVLTLHPLPWSEGDAGAIVDANGRRVPPDLICRHVNRLPED